MTETTRRTVMLSAGGAGMAAVLTACAGYGEPAAGGGETSATAASEAPGKSADTGAGSGSDSAAEALAKTADIPEGGGKVFKDEKIVITQPTAGQFKAFSSACTHQGCDVDKVADGTIDCPCHGSKFKITDGSVVDGPATKPLPEKTIKVDGDSITLA
ncbi:Rieske (2Fe-2S) protein [Streptosporangium longisporum]|uniref:Cytochrome bc1 complex Rieske iron-sulfur subunit n=1 Tax=Streptosporangium longisporum TaxID=46187 RepID=A0ABP6L5R9_9ACTN